MPTLRLLALLLVAVTIGSFIWASLWYFRQEKSNRRKFVYKTSLYLCMGIHGWAIAVSNEPPLWSLIGGIVLLLLILAVFWSAVAAHGPARPAFAFDQHQVTRIVQTGPYRFVRHPFYTSFLLAQAASAMIAGQPVLLLTIPWLAAFYVQAAREEESFLLSNDLAEEYRAYCKRTGRFLPRLPRVRQASKGDSP